MVLFIKFTWFDSLTEAYRGWLVEAFQIFKLKNWGREDDATGVDLCAEVISLIITTRKARDLIPWGSGNQLEELSL